MRKSHCIDQKYLVVLCKVVDIDHLLQLKMEQKQQRRVVYDICRN